MKLLVGWLCVVVVVVVVCRCCVSLSLSLLCVWLWCVCVRCGVFGDTLKNPCVYNQNVPVCTGTTPTCVNTCGCGAGTHGDVLNVFTGETGRGVIVSSAYQILPT